MIFYMDLKHIHQKSILAQTHYNAWNRRIYQLQESKLQETHHPFEQVVLGEQEPGNRADNLKKKDQLRKFE
jgi:hypothetical protein